MEPDGSVVVATPLHSHGQSHETTFAQVVADEIGVRIENIRYVQGDTSATPLGGGTWGSRSAVVGTGMVRRAAGDVADTLRRLAGTMLEADPGDIVLAQGRATIRGVPGSAIDLAEVASFGYYGADDLPEELRDAHTLTSTRPYDPSETYSNGAIGALVEVDVETGMLDIQRMVAVCDCGRMLNPMVVEGQMAGAVIQGVGAALLEEIIYDDDGQLVTASLMDYLYPTPMEVRSLDLAHLETLSATEGGVKGMGEGGTIAAPAAIVNAVSDALSPFGIAIARTPVGPSQLLELIRAARSPTGGA
jgi:carbon-monoxide dehydrogenase large subunit